MMHTVMLVKIMSDNLGTVLCRFLAFCPKKFWWDEGQTAWSFRQQYSWLRLLSGLIGEGGILLILLSHIFPIV